MKHTFFGNICINCGCQRRCIGANGYRQPFGKIKAVLLYEYYSEFFGWSSAIPQCTQNHSNETICDQKNSVCEDSS